ncbi:glycosyltransferase [Deinococcus multiflagellatus]|uniref:Glycosyltransferase n=1 Tax=Deinococcus multiflagellatus TaxID=1656887 RepID=A0ABW1ZQC5_9DEIO
MLLEIARRLPAHVPLYVPDRFPDPETKANFENTVQRDQLPITVLPRVKPGEIDQLLGRASIALSTEQDLPNMHLGYHAKLFDYMAFGLPIVASHVQSNARIVGQAGAGILVKPDDAQAYVDAALHLLSEAGREERDRMAQAGMQAVQDHFSWEAEQHALIGHFQQVLNSSAQRMS